MRKYGVSVTEEMYEDIEEPLAEGDSRSQRIRELIRLGLAAEETMTENHWFPQSIDKREELVRDSIQLYFDTELD